MTRQKTQRGKGGFFLVLVQFTFEGSNDREGIRRNQPLTVSPTVHTIRKYKNVFPSFQPTSALLRTLRNGISSVSLLSRCIADPQVSFEGQASIFTSKQAYTCMGD